VRTARPRLRGICAAIAAGLLAVACGGGSDTPGDQASGSQSAVGTDAFPVTIEHKFGETEITEQPERVVTVGLTDHDALLALGVAPVGVTEWFGDQPHATWPWAQDELGDAKPEVVGESSAVNFEAIAAQRPDLILALYSGLNEQEYETLSEIAPTVAQPGEYVAYGIPWEELTLKVGQAVGRLDEAEELVADVEERFADIRASHPEFEGASAIVATPYEGIYIYGPEDPRGRLLEKMGFEVPAWAGEVAGEEFGGNLSLEKVDLLDLDLIVWLDSGGGSAPVGGDVYSSLDVHKEGRELRLDSFNEPLGAATSFVSVLSLPFLLDELPSMFEDAIDGDPTTEVVQGVPR
jgi:iron complex transport system substrate-binding protein